MQRTPVEPNRAQRLAAHLLQAGVDMLHTGTGLGDAPIAPLLAVRQRFAGLPFALDVHTPTLGRQTLLAVDVTLIGSDIAAGVTRVERALKVQGVVFAGRAHMHATNQLVPLVHARGQLVTEMALAMLLGLVCLNALLQALWGRSFGGHRVLLHEGFFVPADGLSRHRHDAGVDHLASTRDVAVAVELVIHRIEDVLVGTGLDQSPLERPDGHAIGRLVTLPQSHEPLEAQPVQKLELHLFVAGFVDLLDHQNPHHRFSRKRRGSATLAARTRHRRIDLRSQRREIHVLGELAQSFAKLVQLRLTFCFSEQTDLDHLRHIFTSRRPHHALSAAHRSGFSRCPKVCRHK